MDRIYRDRERFQVINYSDTWMNEDEDVVMAMRGGGVQLKEEQRVSVCSSTLTEIILYRLRKLTYVLIIARAP